MIPVTYGEDGTALVHTPAGIIGVRNSTHAHELADVLRQTANELEERERERANARDIRVGRLVNARFRTHNVTKPGTQTPTSTVIVNACLCGRLQGCETCDPPLDVA